MSSCQLLIVLIESHSLNRSHSFSTAHNTVGLTGDPDNLFISSADHRSLSLSQSYLVIATKQPNSMWCLTDRSQLFPARTPMISNCNLGSPMILVQYSVHNPTVPNILLASPVLLDVALDSTNRTPVSLLDGRSDNSPDSRHRHQSKTGASKAVPKCDIDSGLPLHLPKSRENRSQLPRYCDCDCDCHRSCGPG